MKAAYSVAAERLRKDGGGGIVAAVDATVNKALGTRFSVTGFPTLKYFENGVFRHNYDGARTAQDIYEFVSSGGGGSKKDEL